MTTEEFIIIFSLLSVCLKFEYFHNKQEIKAKTKMLILICLHFLFKSLPFSFLIGTLKVIPVHTKVKIKSQKKFWTDYSTEIFWFCLQIYFPPQILGNNGNGKKKKTKWGRNWERTMWRKQCLQSKTGKKNLSSKLPLKVQSLFTPTPLTYFLWATLLSNSLDGKEGTWISLCGWCHKKTSLAPKCNKRISGSPFSSGYAQMA